ncbi:hypothetical protein Taro_010676 [Colocasia esculenta]|uniref:Uncharacterized protein n=1 Tax=Colocasia esculenta TaxID=4460 RepID=A0A843U3N4_COLES|nr:hypothetical protein [Colocasia esculenta]
MLAAIPLDADSSWRPPMLMPAWGWRHHRLTATWFYLVCATARDSSPLTPFSQPCNVYSRSQLEYLDKTVELSFFGQPKREKLKSHHYPMCEARHRRDHNTPWAQVKSMFDTKSLFKESRCSI